MQKSGQSYTGIFGLGTQDCGIQESMGPIADRTLEHLGTSDLTIAKLRRYLLETVRRFQAEGTVPGLDPASYRVRTMRRVLPKGMRFEDAAFDMVRIREPAFAK
jgi:phthalate 4,5-dioxygenase